MTASGTAAKVTPGPLSASLPEEALALLRRAGLALGPARELSGGVSSEIWQVGDVCVKRALPRLRVAQVWEAPIVRNRYERMWMQAAGAVVAGAAPRVLAFDDAAGLFAMEYIEAPVWKTQLREGRADPAFAALVGGRLAAIHGATAGDARVAQRFSTDDIFHAIRLEPYLVATGKAHPSLGLAALAERTAATKQCLVHGDVSPKNILVSPGGPVFLDAECAWYGDPAFDLAFCLNHLLLKCLWVPHARVAYLESFDALAAAYLRGVAFHGVEERTASLLPALLLARVDGKSPVEYLTEEGKAHVRRVAPGMLGSESLRDIREAWQRSLT